jgi:hypothetical protein
LSPQRGRNAPPPGTPSRFRRVMMRVEEAWFILMRPRCTSLLKPTPPPFEMPKRRGILARQAMEKTSKGPFKKMSCIAGCSRINFISRISALFPHFLSYEINHFLVRVCKKTFVVNHDSDDGNISTWMRDKSIVSHSADRIGKD